MAAIYSSMKDILFGYDTDIHFENGDIMLTSTGTDFIEREIYKLLLTEHGQWKTNLRLGASPVKFAGEPNTREIAKRLEQYVQEGISFAIAPATSKVQVVPTDYTSVLILIDIYSPDALELSIPFEFSYDNGISKLDRSDPRLTVPKSNEYQVNDISNLTKPNKYWSRMSQRLNNRLL
jgi:hypothetical protein